MILIIIHKLFDIISETLETKIEIRENIEIRDSILLFKKYES